MAAHEKLTKYRAKRDFSRTREPSGEASGGTRSGAAPGRRYVIQQHAARRMHYDFRLEDDGVLLSWAVPKGPSLSPRVRRLAVRTEDHPLDYASFEGVIPAGEYGGGTVLLWDRGTWEPEGDPRAGMVEGKLTFELHGEKLRGRWHLVRTKPAGKAEQWLLFKGKDDAADLDAHGKAVRVESIASAGGAERDIVESEPRSVLTGRTLDEIAGDRDAVWRQSLQAQLGKLELGFPLTNLDKVLYADQGITKAQLVGYLAVAASHMLPHLAHRPLTAVRFPNGYDQQGFFQKHVLARAPDVIDRVLVPGDDDPYMAVHDTAGIIALAQLAALELHVWGAVADHLEHPDTLVLDLDPAPGVAWERVALGALDVKRLLHEAGFESFVKTTGGKGLHVVAPIERRSSWDHVKAFARSIADRLERAQPNAYTANLSKAARDDRIYIDYLRNTRGATAIAPYSPRARAGAPIATPITWDELAAGIDPGAFTLRTVPARLDAITRAPERDPWAGYFELRQRLNDSQR